MNESWSVLFTIANAKPDAESISGEVMACPECKRHLIRLGMIRAVRGAHGQVLNESKVMVWPRAAVRPPAPPEVPDEFATDYREACLVFGDSPKASAALSRRCLQHLLRECAQVKPGTLNREIDEVLPTLPPHLADAVDAVRQIGNFAAHPVKSKSTGEIVGVEPGEAEWLLNVLEGLFGFYFVEPAALKAKRDALNQKLADLGKPALKESQPQSPG